MGHIREATMKAMINGSNLHYVDSGNGDSMPVLFLHGFPFSHEMWKEQIEAVSKKYRAIAYDIKGHGLSDIGDGQYTIEGHVDDLFAFLDYLGIPRAVIIGLSMGGYITLRALERNQDRFLAAVLCDTRSETDAPEGKLRRFAGMVEVKKSGSEQFADTFLKTVFAHESFASKPEAVEFIRRTISRTPPLSIAGTLLALAARTDTSGVLPDLTIPVLILVGALDQVTPPSQSQAMHQRIKGSELQIVPGAAHMSNLENPEFFNRALLAFLDRVTAVSR
jgi:pimeloyl-ACP methyl ester carboxylesterase